MAFAGGPALPEDPLLAEVAGTGDDVQRRTVEAERPGAARNPGRLWRDTAGIASIVAMGCAYLSPALKDGKAFGTFDFVIPLTSLGSAVHRGIPHNRLNSDVVSQMNAWMSFDWRQIHAGHFPLWNDLSLLGLPQFLNFQSSVLSLPDLIGYAVPLRYAFLTAVLVKLLIAGTGAYVLARVIGLHPLGASFAGVTFMLSGPFANWLSWPLSDVVAFLGWIAALAILAYRHEGAMRYPAGLAVAVAFCAYGGFPEANLFVAIGLAVMVVAFVLALAARRSCAAPSPGAAAAPGAAASPGAAHTAGWSRVGAGWSRVGAGWSRVGAGWSRVGAGSVVGLLLAAPLWWPGIQLLHLSHRSTEIAFPGLPATSMSLLAAAGYYGLPTGRNPFFLAGWNYYESVAYIGVIAIVLATVAVVRHWRRPSVVALVALVIACLAITYQTSSFHPVQSLLDGLVPQVEWVRFRALLGLPFGLLGGIGLETLARQWHRRDVFATFALASAAMAAAVVTLWFQHVPGPAASAVRDRSLIWPAALAGLCVLSSLVSGLTRLRSRLPARARALPAWALWLGGVLFLLFAGIGINSYAKTPFPSTAAIARLKHLTGKSLIGLDGGNGTNVQEFVPVGFYPEVNVGYGIAEFAGHDPVILKRYFAVLSPQAPNGGSGYLQPDIDSLAMARRYGVSYVLASSSTPKLKGAALVAKIAGERLYSVPDSSRFTLSGNGGSVAVRHRTPDEYDLTTPALAKKEVLTARLTPLPGWHASVDGRPVRLVDPRLGASPSTLTYQISVPAGRHHVRLWYWPDRLDVGIAAAGVAAGAFLAFWLGTALTRRRRRPPGHRPRRREAGREAASDAFSITFGD